MQIGLDIGSTTIKIAVLDDAGNLLFHKYERHYSQIAEKILALHKELMTKFPTLHSARLAISGSGGIGQLRPAIRAGGFCGKNLRRKAQSRNRRRYRIRWRGCQNPLLRPPF